MSDIRKTDERDRDAAEIRSRIDNAAAVLNTGQAAALRAAIEYTDQRFHREVDGFSSVRDWLTETFDFHSRVAANIASITRLAPKFKALAAAALSAEARIDAVAYAMYRLDKTGLRVVARLPYPEGPQPSPYDTAIACTTPEETIREYCVHASQDELRAEIDRFAALLEQAAVESELSQQSLAWVELQERGDGLWELNGLLSDDTGRLLANYFKTAAPPPRQDEVDADGVLPCQANRDAEALHQMVAAAGTDPNAPKRHGHTATVNVVCDVETLRGEDTGRVPTMDGKAIPVAKARLLACEAGIIPSVFDFRTGEVLELGKEVRLPNTGLRRKLELEQPGGCAWRGCSRPVSWCEAHHVVAWHDGGPTDADNLVLLCRFHHGRIHTDRWTITKTGPGAAEIRRTGCGEEAPCRSCPACAEAGLVPKALIGRDLIDVFPTGLEPEEWAPELRELLNDYARWAFDRIPIKAPVVDSTPEGRSVSPTAAPVTSPPPDVMGERYSELDPIPFLSRPQRAAAEGRTAIRRQAQNPKGSGPLSMSAPSHRPIPDRPTCNPHRPPPRRQRTPVPSRLLIADRLKIDPSEPRAKPLRRADTLIPGSARTPRRTTATTFPRLSSLTDRSLIRADLARRPCAGRTAPELTVTASARLDEVLARDGHLNPWLRADPAGASSRKLDGGRWSLKPRGPRPVRGGTKGSTAVDP